MSTPRSTRSATERRPRADQAGTGLIATVFGVTVFLVFLLVAVQVVFDLYARSSVTAVAYDAARRVAGADGGATETAELRAEATARTTLGRYGQRVEFTWSADDQQVSLAVHVRNPTLLPSLVSSQLGLDTIDRTVRVRREQIR